MGVFPNEFPIGGRDGSPCDNMQRIKFVVFRRQIPRENGMPIGTLPQAIRFALLVNNI